MRERWSHNGHAAFSVEHLIPQKVARGRALDYDNLLYACISCNSLKRDLWPILDPCAHAYGAHLKVNDDGTTGALTVRGSILLDTFHLNDPQRVEYRNRTLQLFRWLQSRQEPAGVRLFERWFGFPDDLPDLRKLRPPKNLRPNGVDRCYYFLRERGQLPGVY